MIQTYLNGRIFSTTKQLHEKAAIGKPTTDAAPGDDRPEDAGWRALNVYAKSVYLFLPDAFFVGFSLLPGGLDGPAFGVGAGGF